MPVIGKDRKAFMVDVVIQFEPVEPVSGQIDYGGKVEIEQDAYQQPISGLDGIVDA